MTQLATPEAVVADFDDVELSRIVPARRPGTKPRIERYRLSRRDDQFWVALEGPDRRMPPRESRVVMTTGSHHQQVVWVWGGRGREIFHLPFTYLIDEGRWIERNQAFLAPPEDPFGEVLWNDICIECHSTGGQPRISQSGAPSNPRVVEFGISCESCHGPGRDHVEANRSPWHRFWNRNLEDPTITNPKRLSARRASHVCGRCHSITSHAVNDVWEGHWNAFEPGDDLEADGRVVMHPESKDPAHQKVIAEHARVEAGRFPRDRFWSDGAVRVAGRELNDVVTSPCFEGGEFSCLSCHAMHDYESVVDQLDSEKTGDRACLQCHERFEQDITAHTAHPEESSGSRCANCHLPYTTYGLLKAIRSHRVSSPSVATELSTGRPNACNACHLDRDLAWTQEHLERKYAIEPVLLAGHVNEVAAGPRWIGTGDAGVRALAASYMSWAPAREASGDDWMTPYLSELLTDRYAAVRMVAVRSLRKQPGSDDFASDLVEAGGAAADLARQRIQASWLQKQHRSPTRGPGPLLDTPDSFDRAAWARLVESRDTRPLALIE